MQASHVTAPPGSQDTPVTPPASQDTPVTPQAVQESPVTPQASQGTPETPGPVTLQASHDTPVTPPRGLVYDEDAAPQQTPQSVTPEVTPRLAAAVGLSMITPEPTPRGPRTGDREPRGAKSGGGARLDFASDAAISEILSPRGESSDASVLDYHLAIQKLEGRKEALWQGHGRYCLPLHPTQFEPSFCRQ